MNEKNIPINLCANWSINCAVLYSISRKGIFIIFPDFCSVVEHWCAIGIISSVMCFSKKGLHCYTSSIRKTL